MTEELRYVVIIGAFSGVFLLWRIVRTLDSIEALLRDRLPPERDDDDDLTDDDNLT